MIYPTTSQPRLVKLFDKGQRAPRRAPSNTAASPVSTTIPRFTAPPASLLASHQPSWDDLIEQPKEMTHLLCGTSSPSNSIHTRLSIRRSSLLGFTTLSPAASSGKSSDYNKLGSARSKKRISPSLTPYFPFQNPLLLFPATAFPNLPLPQFPLDCRCTPPFTTGKGVRR